MHMKKRWLMRSEKKCIISRMKGSFTVESTLIMPLILACIVLLIVVNGYLHDYTILNGLAVEVLYSENEDKELLLRNEMQSQFFWMSNLDISESENHIDKAIAWKNKVSFPLKGLLNMIIDETDLEVSGEVHKQAWSMSQIIRYVNQN